MAIQLEFNMKNESEVELKFSEMQKQLNEMNESMGKVRRKLFAEMGELKKLLHEMKMENENMRNKLNEFSNEKTEWVYKSGDKLFELVKAQEACG